MQFLVAGGNTAPATAFQSALESNLGSVLPPEDWPGASLQGSVASEEVELSLQESELSQVEAEEDRNQTALIVGLAVGREWQQGREGRRGRCSVRWMMHWWQHVRCQGSVQPMTGAAALAGGKLRCRMPSRLPGASSLPLARSGRRRSAAGRPGLLAVAQPPQGCPRQRGARLRGACRGHGLSSAQGAVRTQHRGKLWQRSAPPRRGGRRRATLRPAHHYHQTTKKKMHRSGMTGGKPLHIRYSA